MTITKRDLREVSLFRNGRSQAVRIPKEFEIDADTAVMWRDPDGTIHIRPPKPRRSYKELADWLATQDPLDGDMPEVEELTLEPVDLGPEP